jgi:Uri superfamily endonuclease
MRGKRLNQSCEFPKERTASLFEALPTKGVYTMIIFLSRVISLNVGKLGFHSFPMGYYSYTGSALGIGATSLSQRLLRHLRKEKRNFWHIDFLLTQENAVVVSVVAAPTHNRKIECEINSCIKERCQAKVPVPGFGASDCGKNCRSHLLYFGKRVTEKNIATLYAEMGLKPITIRF